MSTDSRLDDDRIRREMPYPIAAAWHRVTLASGSEARVHRAVVAFEVGLRFLGACLLAEYLRGPPDPTVEAMFTKLARPALGHWMELCRETLKVVSNREEPAPFLPIAELGWLGPTGKPTSALKRIQDVVSLRNRLQHQTEAAGQAAWEEHATAMISGVRTLLGTLAPLRVHRVVRATDQHPTRRRTSNGLIQIFRGHEPLPEPIPAEWTAQLLPGACYLLAPAGDAVLELSPFVQTATDPEVRDDRLMVFKGFDRKGHVELACDETGGVVAVQPQGDRGPLPLDPWLEQRAARDPWQPNVDLSGTLGLVTRTEDRAGDLLGGRYEIGEVLGRGGMATVYRANDLLSRVPVALKVLHPELASDPVFRERFKREAAAMRALQHPNIVRHVELGELETAELFLRMPLLTGGTLSDRLAQHGPVEGDALDRLARELLSALEHLAEHGVVHRDLKPSNLLFDERGSLVLADFGIALDAADVRLTRTIQQLGSLAYMAPEHRLSGVTTPLSDVFAAAMVLQEAATGELPEVPTGKGVPGTLGLVIRRMGATDPKRRVTAEEALALLEDPARAAAEAALPSDDGRIATTAGVAAIVGNAVLWAGAAPQFPGLWFPEHAVMPAAVSIAAAAAAYLVAPSVAGAYVGATCRGEPTSAGGFTGALTALGIHAVAGSLVFSVMAADGFITTVQNEARGIAPVVAAAQLGAPLIQGAVAVFLGLAVAGALGAVLGSAGAAATRDLRRAEPTATSPDDSLRLLAATTLGLVNPLLLLAVASAIGALGASLGTAFRAADQVLADVIGPFLVAVALTPLLATVAVTLVLGLPPLVRQWGRPKRGSRVSAGIVAFVLLSGGPLAVGLSCRPDTLGFAASLLVIGTQVLGSLAATVWFARRASTQPPLPDLPTSTLRDVPSTVMTWFLAVFIVTYAPLGFGAVAGLLVVPGIGPLVAGDPGGSEIMERGLWTVRSLGTLMLLSAGWSVAMMSVAVAAGQAVWRLVGPEGRYHRTWAGMGILAGALGAALLLLAANAVLIPAVTVRATGPKGVGRTPTGSPWDPWLEQEVQARLDGFSHAVHHGEAPPGDPPEGSRGALLLAAWTASTGPSDGQAAGAFIASRPRDPLGYRIRLRGLVPVGVPTLAQLREARAIAWEAESWCGEIPEEVLGELVALELRAGRPDVAEDLLHQAASGDVPVALAGLWVETGVALDDDTLVQKGLAAFDGLRDRDARDAALPFTRAIRALESRGDSMDSDRIEQLRAWNLQEIGFEPDPLADIAVARSWRAGDPDARSSSPDACTRAVMAVGIEHIDDALPPVGPCDHAGAGRLWAAVARDLREP
ncbi:MAG: serine/threonine-protein kinase [Myxococcota bacterium]